MGEKPTYEELELKVKDLKEKITAQKNTVATKALMESEERYRTLFESSPDAITTTDLQGTVTDCNQKTIQLHGFSSKEEVIGQHAFTMINPKEHEKAKVNLVKTMDEGHSGTMEYTLLKKEVPFFANTKKSGKSHYLQIVENRKKKCKFNQGVIFKIRCLGRLDRLHDKGRVETLMRSMSRFSESALMILIAKVNTVIFQAVGLSFSPTIFEQI